MKQYIVTAKKLNKRKFPVNDFNDKTNIAGVVENGFIFQGEEATDLANSLGKWYKDRDGYYYWSGGLTEKEEPNPDLLLPLQNNILQFDPLKMSWGHKWYDLPIIWNEINTKGKNVTIAVIDTGADVSHPDLISNIHPLSKSFVGDRTTISDTDGHGTNMAGIIGASGKSKVFGVAPDCKVLIIKASNNSRGDEANPKVFAEALTFASSIPEINIISFSNIFNDDPDLKVSIQKCISNNKFVFAAIGNERDLDLQNDPDKNTYPACYEGVVAVGAFNEQGNLCGFSNWNSQLSLLAPGDFNILTTGLDNSVVKGGQTSIATAFAAGCFGLMLSYAKAHSIHLQSCRQALLESCDDIGSKIGKDIQSGYGRMNLRNAILKIKQL
jgi:major intracellular serine protease